MTNKEKIIELVKEMGSNCEFFKIESKDVSEKGTFSNYNKEEFSTVIIKFRK